MNVVCPTCGTPCPACQAEERQVKYIDGVTVRPVERWRGLTGAEMGWRAFKDGRTAYGLTPEDAIAGLAR